MARIPETSGNPHGIVDPKQVHSPDSVENEAALQIVIQDAERTESWLQSRLWNLRWLEADVLYQSPPGINTWEGTTIPMANVSKFTVAIHVNSLKGKAITGLFYDDPPFVVRPRPATGQNEIRAITAVQAAQLDEMGFRQEVELGFFSALLFGTGLWKWGWKQCVIINKKYVRKAKPVTIDMPAAGHSITVPTPESDEFEVHEKEEVVSYPWLENVDLRHALVDPGLRRPDVREAKFVVHKMDVTYRDLVALKDDIFAEYDLPSEEEIKSWFEPPKDTPPATSTAEQYSQNTNTNYIMHAAPRFEKTTVDPLDEPLELLERVDNDKIVTVLNRVRVIRNEKNPFGKINWYSVNWWSNQDCFWGSGLGRVLGGEQRVQQGLTNAMLDITSLISQPTYVRARGANVPTQQIRQRIGGIIDVDVDRAKGVNSVRDAFTLLEQPRIPGEIFSEIAASEARAESASGANEQLTVGSMGAGGKTSLGRTATGAGGIMAAAEARLGSFVEDFNRQVYMPWLWQMHDLNCERLTPAQMRKILGEELGKDFKLDEESYFNAAIKEFEVLAGAHLVAKQQQAQSLGFIIQLFENPQTMQSLEARGYYVDIQELMHMLHDVSGWKNYYDVIKPLTDEMKQNMQANNPNVIKAQAAAASQKQKTTDKGNIIDQENMARAVRDVLREVIKKAIGPEMITGEPGGVGFGSNTPA